MRDLVSCNIHIDDMTVTEKPVQKVEEASDSEDLPELEDGGAGSEEEEVSASGRIILRAEKKARKMMVKLGLKPVKGITRVTIKRQKNVYRWFASVLLSA